MSFTQAVRSVLSKYVDFTGRAPRSEYWWFFVFCIVIGLIFGVVDGVVGNTAVSTIATLALALPSIAVTARRLHDMGQSGWWCLLGLIPLIGALVLMIWCAFPGTPGANRFGTDPLDPDARPYPE